MQKRMADILVRPGLTALLVAGVALTASHARAQQQAEDQQPVLPDLAPREVEIRGELQISFPSLRRQPLVGFNPPPRVPEISMERRPTLESYTDAGASITKTSLEKPEAPGLVALSGEPPFWAEAEVSAGRYFSRLIRGLASKQVGDDGRVDVQLRYEGSDGHVVSDPSEDIKNASNDFSGTLAYGIRNERLSASAEVSGFVSGYSLYGLDTSSGNVVPNPDRNGSHGTLRIALGSGTRSSLRYEITASLARSEFSSDLFSSDVIVDPATERIEKRGSLSGQIRLPVGSTSVYASGAASWAGLDSDGLVGSDLKQGDLGMGLEHRTDRLTFVGGPRVLGIGFTPEAAGTPGEDRSATYLSADVDLKYRYGDVLTISGTNRPHVITNSLDRLFTINPFLENEPGMQPSIMTVDAEAGLLFSSGLFQFKASVKMKQSPNWMYFVASAGSGTSTVAGGFFDTRYSEGRVTSAGGEVALSLPAGVQLSSAAYVHDTKLTDLDVQIPYHPQLTGEVGLSIPFASRRGILQATGRYIGERHADLEEMISVDAYLDLDVYARYDIRPSIGLVARLQNVGLTDHEVWNGYPQSPAVLMAGVRLLW